jgi:hypothetical protein
MSDYLCSAFGGSDIREPLSPPAAFRDALVSSVPSSYVCEMGSISYWKAISVAPLLD